MRNSLVDIKYLDDDIEYRERHANKDRCFALYEELNVGRAEKGRPRKFGVLTSSMSRSYLEVVSFRYTRGDDLNEINSKVMQVALDNMIIAFEELEKYGELEEFYYHAGSTNKYYGKRNLTVGCLLTLLTEMAWYICFRVDETKLKFVSKHFVYDNVCLAIDTIMARYHAERAVADNNPTEAEFLTFWNQFVQANKSKQETLLPDYLNDWARILTADNEDSSVSIVSAGANLAINHLSNDTLPEEVEGENHPIYKGYWAWEVALMVAFFELDDSEIRDHPLYPVELVDYYRSTS